MNKKISNTEAFCILLMFSINGILLNSPKILITQNKTGAFLNSIIIGLIGFIFIIVLTTLLKKFPSFDILDISNYLGGTKLKTFVGFLFIFILLFLICLYIAQFVVLLKTVYFRNSPIIYILLFFIIAIYFCNINGFGAVKKSICFYFPISIITIFLVVTYNLSEFSLIKITPFFGNSIKDTVFSGSSNIYIFTNIIFIYFVLPFLDNIKEFRKISIISFFISWIILILMVTSILSFYPLNNNITDINSIYTLTRRIELTEFLQRADGLFVIIALLSCMSYLSFLLYLITLIIKKILIIENENMISYSILPFLLGITHIMITSNYYKNNGEGLYRLLFNFTIYILCFVIIILSIIKKNKLRTKKNLEKTS